MKAPARALERPSTFGVMMTPMIDVVFLLLIFFLWTASFQAVEHSLPSSVVSATGSGSELPPDPALVDLDRIVIHLAWQQGRPIRTINNRMLPSLMELRKALVAIAAIQPKVPVVVDSSPEVPLGHVIDVYDISQLEGFANVRLAVADEP
jgi:biopolymer transport protein ExbD